MMNQATDQEFFLIRDLIYEKCGILLENNKKYLIENRLAGLKKQYQMNSFMDLYQKLKHPGYNSTLLSEVIDAITTNETLWLRDKYPFEILDGHILPKYQQEIKASGRQSLHIWSAASSTGQEAYSIAMTCLNYNRANGLWQDCHSRIKILGTDISPSALSVAKQGRYNMMAINRGLPRNYLETYFRKIENDWIIDEKIRDMVAFKEFNLMDPFAGLMGPFDIIFLRNVIIYFSEEVKRQLINRIIRILKPGGYFFLGTGESVSLFTDAFETKIHEKATFYQLKC